MDNILVAEVLAYLPQNPMPLRGKRIAPGALEVTKNHPTQKSTTFSRKWC